LNFCILSLDKFYDGWYPPPGFEDESLHQNITQPNLFQDAQVKCGPVPSVVPHCGGKGYSPCLFNITADPCEYVDLSDKYPDIYDMMTRRLAWYQKGMVKPRRDTSTDPEANPKRHDGSWIPWRKAKKLYSLYSDITF